MTERRAAKSSVTTSSESDMTSDGLCQIAEWRTLRLPHPTRSRFPEKGAQALLALGRGALLGDPPRSVRAVGPLEHEALCGPRRARTGSEELRDDPLDR